MQDSVPSNRISYFEALRLLASLAVIFIHVASQNWYSANTSSIEWQIFNFYDSLSRWGAPIFVMISGALFLDKQHPVMHIIKKYVFRMVCVFAFWSAIYAYTYYITGIYDKDYAIRKLFVGNYHLWFPLMISALYLSTPVIQTISNHKKTTEYFMILALVFSSILPFITGVVSVFSVNAGNLIQEIIANFRFTFTGGYVFYFIAGHYLHKNKISDKCQKLIYCLGVLNAVLTVFLTSYFSIISSTYVDFLYKDLAPNVIAMSCSVFLFAKNNLTKHRKWINILSKYSFGAYLIHVLILEMLNHFAKLNTFSCSPYFSVPLLSILIGLLSYFFSALLNQIPIIKKYVL